MSTRQPRRLILCAAVGYAWDAIAPFARSLRASGYEDEVWLLVGSLSPTDRRQLHEHRIRPVYAAALQPCLDPQIARVLFNRRLRGFHRAWPRWCELLPLPAAQRRAIQFACAARLSHILSARYLHSYRLLRDKAAACFDEIMLTDVRDVIFQSNPFPAPIDTDLCFMLEDPRASLGSEPHNTRWISQLFGYDYLDSIRDRPISCAGTTYGTRAGMLDYLDAMSTEIISKLMPVSGQPGFDQGIHNHLIASGRFPTARLIPNGTGPVLTIQEMDPADIRMDERGVLDASGRLIPVLHQYDRHPGLREMFLRRYAA